MKDDVLQFLGNLVREAQAAALHNSGRVSAGLETAEFIRGVAEKPEPPAASPKPDYHSKEPDTIAQSSSKKPNGRIRPPRQSLADYVRDILKERHDIWNSVPDIQIALDRLDVKATQDQITRILIREKREGVVQQKGKQGLYRLIPLRSTR